MDPFIQIGYAAGVALFVALPFAVFGRQAVTRPYTALVFFSWIYALSYFLVPLLAAHENKYLHPVIYEPGTMLMGLALFVLFGGMVYLGYILAAAIAPGRAGDLMFAYERWTLLPKRTLRIGSLICGALVGASLAWFAIQIISHGLGGFLQNRIVLLSGLGYLSAVMLWPMPLIVVVLSDTWVGARRGGPRRGYWLAAFFLVLAVSTGLVTGSRTTVLMPVVMTVFAATLLSARGRFDTARLARLGGLAVALLLVALVLGQLREQVFSKVDLREIDRAGITAGAALVGAYGEYEHLWWMEQNPSHVEFLGGKTFIAAAVGFVPRRLWPGKPLGGGPYLTNMVNPGGYDLTGGTNISSYTTGLVVESYMNFGRFGPAIAGFGFGILLAMLDAFRRRVHTPLMFALWIVLLLRMVLAPKAEVFGNVGNVFSTSIPLVIFWFLARLAGGGRSAAMEGEGIGPGETAPERLLTIITPAADIAGYPRLHKLLATLDDAGIAREHWYWNREEGGDPPGRCLHRGGGYSNRRLVFHYGDFMIKTFLAVFAERRDRSFYCLGFAAALPVAAVARLTRCDYLYDNNDNLSLSHAWPRPLRVVIAAAERFIARGARIHLVPSLARWQADDANLRVVTNVPSSEVLARARKIAAAEGLARGETLTVYVNGLLTGQRGMDPLRRVLERWDPERPLRILLAGRLRVDAARELVDHPLVEYLGMLDNAEALAHYAQAHVALTFYNPVIAINRLAEPNKWGDCVVMGTPFIVNAEVETARPFVERGACFTVPYGDAEALRDLLAGFVAGREPLDRATEALSSFAWRPWEEQIMSVMDEFTGRTTR